MAVTLDQIKQLRDMTCVSMTACKKALEEAGGDMDKAIDVLRKSGEAKSVDRAARATNQGIVAIKIEGGKAAMTKLLCETDFASRSDDFVKVAEALPEKLLGGKISDGNKETQELKDLRMKTGENIQVGDLKIVEGEVLGSYIHTNKKIGVVVALKGGTVDLAKEVAMHAAATKPTCVSPDEVAQELVDKEKEIWTEQLSKEGKPKEIVEKIMMGKEKKFREENALTKQPFVKDPSKTIEQFLSEGGASVTAFYRMAV
jgi:elongation factor Ts